MFNLKDKVVVITGASSGLGKQMSYGFAKMGANLVLLARRIEKLEELKHDLEQYNVKVVPIKYDVLVNCAGASKDNNLLDMSEEEWNFTIETDLTSIFKVTKVFANIMKENNYGRIINISSMYGLVGNTKIPTIAYHSSKGGVINFTRAAAAELAKYNITVNCICPGYFNTELTKEVLETPDFISFAKEHVPMGRYGNEGELNGGVIFLASDEASYITGAIIPIDGGYTCV